MSLPIEAAVSLFTLGWVAGVGTALVCRSARSSRTCRELMRDPPGWRSYAPVSRPRHANSDNGGPSTATPAIEPQALVKPSFPPPRKIWEGFTAEETQAGNAASTSQRQAPIRHGYETYASLQHLSELMAELLADQDNAARIAAIAAICRRGSNPPPPANP